MHCNINQTEFLSLLESWEQNIKDSILDVAEQEAAKMETEAKRNAPWKDQSGQARASIAGEAGWESNNICKICLSGNTPYFEYLEFAKERRFAILWSTVSDLAPEALYSFSNILKY